MKTRQVVFLAALLAVALATPALAAEPWDISVTNITFGTISASDFKAGYKTKIGHSVSLKAPKRWRITLKANGPNLGTSSDGRYVKPLSDLEFKLSSSSTWTQLHIQDRILKMGNAGSSTFMTDYRVRLRWAHDRPGSYGCTLVYTITEN